MGETPEGTATREEIGALRAYRGIEGTGDQPPGLAGTLRMSGRTVRRLLRAGSFVERASPRPGPQPLDAFFGHLHQRWEEGGHNAAQLWREIQQRGFAGCQFARRPYLAGWRAQLPADLGRQRRQILKGRPPQAVPPSRSAAWLLLGYGSTRDTMQQAFRWAYLTQLCASCDEVRTGQTLMRAFFRIVRRRLGEEFDDWRLSVSESQIPEVMGFASGLKQDKAAGMAARTVEGNDGQTEGQVNRLTFLKRRGFGRANVDLLRWRILPPW